MAKKTQTTKQAGVSQPFYERKFREYLKKYHPDKYEELIFLESKGD
jgi:hypothetical protein